MWGAADLIVIDLPNWFLLTGAGLSFSVLFAVIMWYVRRKWERWERG